MNKARSERRRREKNNNHHHHQVLHYWLQHNSNDNNKQVKCSNKILERWAKAEQYKSLKQERAHKTNKLSFWSLSLSLSKAGRERASEHATQDCETKDRKRDAAGDAQTASKRASAHARGVPQKNQIYIVNLGNFILNALGFGWVLCAARRIHSFIHPFIGEISKHHIYIYKVIAKKFKNQTC